MYEHDAIRPGWSYSMNNSWNYFMPVFSIPILSTPLLGLCVSTALQCCTLPSEPISSQGYFDPSTGVITFGDALIHDRSPSPFVLKFFTRAPVRPTTSRFFSRSFLPRSLRFRNRVQFPPLNSPLRIPAAAPVPKDSSTSFSPTRLETLRTSFPPLWLPLPNPLFPLPVDFPSSPTNPSASKLPITSVNSVADSGCSALSLMQRSA